MHDRKIAEKKGIEQLSEWKEKLLHKEYDVRNSPGIGQLRASWKDQYKTDLDNLVQPLLFRILCSYLDQGISIWQFPVSEDGFLSSI